MAMRTARAFASSNASKASLTPKIGRRGLIASVPLLAASQPAARAGLFSKGSGSSSTQAASAAPVVDQPMRRLRLPKGTVGRDYVLIQLMVDGKGPFDFMVDSGLTAELITPHLRQTLNLKGSGQKLATGLAAGGSVNGGELVQLKGVSLPRSGDGDSNSLALPPLTAVVTSFVQEHLDPAHDPVEGMLGMEVLELFDADFDFPANRLRLWAPGQGAAAAAAAGLVEVPAAVLNETGLLGIRVTSPQGQQAQPFVGIVDCGASFSALNWQAAALAGLPRKGGPSYAKSQKIYGVGIDGQPLPYPTNKTQLTFAGHAVRSGAKGSGLAFEPPPSGWKPWDPVMAAIGDLPVFSQLLGDGRTPFNGPAALIGLDVLAQRRVVLGAGRGVPGRQRRLFVSKR